NARPLRRSSSPRAWPSGAKLTASTLSRAATTRFACPWNCASGSAQPGRTTGRRSLMARSDGIDELDPRFPIRLTDSAPVFWRLLRHPPVTSRWRAHLDFTVTETARALAAQAALVAALGPGEVVA